jgi:hypothetical protein
VVRIDLNSDRSREAEAVVDRIEAWTKVETSPDGSVITVELPQASNLAEGRDLLSADLDSLDMTWRDHFSFRGG